jgi:hypothetical protein
LFLIMPLISTTCVLFFLTSNFATLSYTEWM